MTENMKIASTDAKMYTDRKPSTELTEPIAKCVANTAGVSIAEAVMALAKVILETTPHCEHRYGDHLVMNRKRINGTFMLQFGQ